MAKYRVRYYECYEGYYEVEANSKKKLKRNLSVTDLMNCHGFAYMNCHQIDWFSVISQPHRAAA